MTPVTLGDFVGAFYPTWDREEFRRLVRVLDLPPDRKVGTFSGGMKVKLGLALALAHRPRLLVLDEPMAGLDPVARREFLEMVRDQAESSGRTTFFSTHLIDEIELAAHRVGIVDGGRTLFQGRTADLSAEVRLLTCEPGEAGDGDVPVIDERFELLQRREREGRLEVVVRASDPTLFETLGGSGWRQQPMALEEIFVEMVRKPFKS